MGLNGKSAYVLFSILLSALIVSGCLGDDHEYRPSAAASQAFGDNALHPDAYNFEINMLESGPLTMEIACIDDFTATIENTDDLAGSYEFSTDTWTLNRYSNLHILTVSTGNPVFGTLHISFADPIRAVGNGGPSSGSLSILGNNGTITATFTAGGITMESGKNEKTCTWGHLNDTLNSPSAWEGQAALACMVVRMLLNEADSILETISLIVENKDDFTTASPRITVTGDDFSGTPPQGISDDGVCILSLADCNKDSQVSRGDSFTLTYLYPWDSGTGTFTYNTVTLNNYLRTVESIDGTDIVTSTGFPSDNGGGVLYEDLTRFGVTETSPGVFSKDLSSMVTLNGGYSIVFTE